MRWWSIGVVMAMAMWCAAARSDEPRKIAISVTEDGFVPKRIAVQRGELVDLVFTRQTDHTCAKDVIVYVTDDEKIERKLPLNLAVSIVTRFPKSGEFGFACSMFMKSGRVFVR